MKTRERNFLIYCIATFVIIVLLTSLLHIKAVAKESYFSKDTDIKETEFKSEIRNALTNNGAKNAGINMTKCSEDGKSFTYKVSINLPSYINLNEERESTLREILSEIPLDIENASVSFFFS